MLAEYKFRRISVKSEAYGEHLKISSTTPVIGKPSFISKFCVTELYLEMS
jgi:hypothetical protein